MTEMQLESDNAALRAEIKVWKSAFLEKGLMLLQAEEKIAQLKLRLEQQPPDHRMVADLRPPTPTEILFEEGGQWSPAHAGFLAVRFSNGKVWDTVAGWRKDKP